MDFDKNISPYVVAGIAITSPRPDEIHEIIDYAIEKVFNTKSDVLREKSRKREIAVPRQTYTTLLVDFANIKPGEDQPKELSTIGIKLFEDVIDNLIIKDPGYSLTEIGAFFNQDHSTVIHAYKIIKDDWIHDKYYGYGEKVLQAYSIVRLQLVQRYKNNETVDKINYSIKLSAPEKDEQIGCDHCKHETGCEFCIEILKERGWKQMINGRGIRDFMGLICKHYEKRKL